MQSKYQTKKKSGALYTKQKIKRIDSKFSDLLMNSWYSLFFFLPGVSFIVVIYVKLYLYIITVVAT